MSQIIGAEALLQPNTQTQWSGGINFRPGDGTTVDINPPRFSWQYNLDPETYYTDQTIHHFLFEVSANSDMSSPTVSIAGLTYNFYNFLEPFTAGTWYWRIGYSGPDDVVDEYSDIRSFTVGGGCPEWDRSMLADNTYLNGKSHPRILFTASNRAAIKTWLDANDGGILIGDWSSIKAIAASATGTAWWAAEEQPDPGVLDAGTWAAKVGYVAFCWGITQDSAYSTGLASQLDLVADYYLANGGPQADVVSDSTAGACSQTIGQGYDWAFDILSSGQKANLVDAMAQRSVQLLMCDDAAGLRQFGRHDSILGDQVEYWSGYKRANSHGYYNMTNTVNMLLAGYDADTDVRAAFDTVLSYFIGVGFPYGFEGSANQGRGYGIDDMFSSGLLLKVNMTADTVFPEVGFATNPFWESVASWWDNIIPVAANQVHEPWGDGSTGAVTNWGAISFGRNLALFMQSGSIQRHYINQLALPPYNGSRSSDIYDTITFLYTWATPSQSSATPGTRLYADGWVIGNTVSQSTSAGFEDGLGMIFQARPCGGAGSHDNFSDGNFQFWAYGAPITDSGGAYPGEYGHTGMAHYCLMVDGLSTAMPFGSPIEGYYSYFYGYKDSADYLYVAADLTQAYPIQNFTPGGALLPATWIALHSGGPLATLSKVRRQILWMRGKYWVMFDELEDASNTRTFSDPYHIYPDTVTLDSGNVKWHYTVENLDTDDVTVYVAHIGTGAGLTVDHLTGSDVASNPVTSEDYLSTYADGLHRAHAIWVSNTTPALAHTFYKVIFPVAPGGTTPTITRIDDKTVRVQQDAIDDTISFDPANTTADFIVRLDAVFVGTGISGLAKIGGKCTVQNA